MLSKDMLACPTCGSVYARSQEFCGLDGTQLVQTHKDPMLGRTVGRYLVEAPLGAGGMSRVYRGRHEALDRPVAVKVLHGELSADHHIVQRFVREARSLARIGHPGVVEVFDFGRTDGGVLYMVMELVEGPTVAERLHSGGPMAPSEAARVLVEVSLGLEAAHAAGYVHRDLKPQNLVFDTSQVPAPVKILDFGLVGLVEGEEQDSPLTRPGTFFGTPRYMAPEQAAGERCGPPADLYSLGVILYELLTGSPPFSGDVRQLAHQHVHAAPPRPALAYGGLGAVALRLLAKDPSARPTPSELREELRQLRLSTTTHPQTPAVSLLEPPSDLRLDVPIERDEFSAEDGASSVYERAALGPTRRGRTVVGLALAAALGGAAYLGAMDSGGRDERGSEGSSQESDGGLEPGTPEPVPNLEPAPAARPRPTRPKSEPEPEPARPPVRPKAPPPAPPKPSEPSRAVERPAETPSEDRPRVPSADRPKPEPRPAKAETATASEPAKDDSDPGSAAPAAPPDDLLDRSIEKLTGSSTE